jgi:serine-type D-Ala-D-Ala carboxypeptidase
LALRSADLSAASSVLLDAVRARVFPGAAYSIFCRGDVLTGAMGRYTYHEASAEVSPDTIYDVASLTKVVATTPMAMLLYERGKLQLDLKLGEILPQFLIPDPDPRREQVTLRMLLAHSSGLPAYEKLFLRAHGREEMLRALYSVPLTADPGTRAEYSDVGFMLLGLALERLAGESLDTFVMRDIFARLDMGDTVFLPSQALVGRLAPSEDDREFRHRVVCGEVNDENAWALGGIAGHAGLFSTAVDIAKLSAPLLSGGAPVFQRETIDLFTRREPSPPGTSRSLGWDTPSQPSSSGKYFSPHSYGHLGFTGTSLWIDPERDLAITLLTNRTWPNRGSQEGIRRVRPAFHNAVVEALLHSCC